MCFSISLIVSIHGMPLPANYIGYLICLQIDIRSGSSPSREKEIIKDRDKIKGCSKYMIKTNRVVKRAFISGVVLFLLYAAIRLVV